jgi:hypothetical protein
VNDVRIDTVEIHRLTDRGAEVDRHVHRVADTAYAISQRLVPQPGDPFDPYATGRLKVSGTVERGPGRATWDVTYGNRRVNYAIYVEMGTRHMHAEPYLRPALLEAVRFHDRI